MKKPGTILIIAGITILLGAILYTPTVNLIKGNAGSPTAKVNNGVTEESDGTVYAEGELVSDFPTVPVYPGAVVVDSVETNDSTGYGYSGTWHVTGKTWNEVLKYYLAEAKKRKWNITHQPDLGPKSSDQYIEALVDGKKVTVSVELEDDNKTIEIRIVFPLKSEN